MQVRNYIEKYGYAMFCEKILAKLFGAACEVQYRKRKEAFWKLKNKDAIKQGLTTWYEEQMGEKIDLEHPITFTEKIQWMKINDMDELKTKLADKWEVREWIKEKIGEEYLVPVYGIFEDYDEIDFSELPEKFVIKANHGSGMVFVVNDKKKINHKKLRQKTKIWKATNYAYQNGFEMQYKDQKRRIMVEKYISEIDKILVDYKFHCFNGKVDFIQVICDRNMKTHEMSHCFLNKNWEKMETNWGGNGVRLLDNVPSKPINLEKMIEIAERLSSDLKYVRVDLYNIQGKIWFGEMTFTPASGILFDMKPTDWNKVLGDKIKIHI